MATLGSGFRGQAASSCWAYSGFKVGSIEDEYKRSAKRLQCENPRVWAPDNAIISIWLRLCLANMVLSWLRLKFGSGRLPATRDAWETRPSRRPSSTLNEGPPA